jgi:transcriptional regulator of acetoin/glycerol metabolism
LHNALRVAVALLDDHESVISPRHLPEELFEMDADLDAQVIQASSPPASVIYQSQGAQAESLEVIERRAIEQVLADEAGHVSRAARRLGISRNTLYRKIGRL